MDFALGEVALGAEAADDSVEDRGESEAKEEERSTTDNVT